ncbi:MULTISPECIES: isochorismatase family protein [Prochlorococcus]|uniref:isochorismatase family protein n=1 Tax=Prochlorococcus TaxID=1218 RepID=UPI0005339BC0|nr:MULTISPECIES: isochorismatase family protein [Prochlorococcus]KGG12595.1 Isochorismatase [Prochlorococcus sp. MIT 0601]
MSQQNTALIIIDVQEKLVTSIENKELIMWNINRLIDACKIFNMKIYVTEQNPEKLGKTIEQINKCLDFQAYKKMSFSSFHCKDLSRELKSNAFENIIICGIESHVCIMQSALDYINSGKNIFIPVDSIGSRRTIDHETSLQRLSMSGAIVTTTETAIFELCKSADFEDFKAVSSIIKRKME